jgi:hypothetical protein
MYDPTQDKMLTKDEYLKIAKEHSIPVHDCPASPDSPYHKD